MSAACLSAAGLCVLGGMLGAALSALLPARGAWVAVAAWCGAAGLLAAGLLVVGLLIMGLPIVMATAGDVLPDQVAIGIGLALLAGLFGQARLAIGGGDAVDGGWRGRLVIAAGPLLVALALVGAGVGRGLAGLAAGASGVLALAGLCMVAHRARGGALSWRPAAVPLLEGRFAGLRLLLAAGAGLSLIGFGALVAAVCVRPSTAVLPGMAAIPALAGLALFIGLFPVQSIALGWVRTAPPWLAGTLTASVCWPSLLCLLRLRAGALPGEVFPVALTVLGGAGLLAASWLAAVGRLAVRDAAWLALSALVAAGVGGGGVGGGGLDAPSGAALAVVVQVLVACLPPSLSRLEALAMLVGCAAPWLMVAAAPSASLPVSLALLAGFAGLASGVVRAVPAPAPPRDRCRWVVLTLLLVLGLAMPSPLARALRAVAAESAPAPIAAGPTP